jgi:hypothetical protein
VSVFLDTRGNSSLAVGICGRCSRKFPIGDLQPDLNYPGLMVCEADRDNFDPYRLPARQTENIALRYARPDTPLTDQPQVAPAPAEATIVLDFVNGEYTINGVSVPVEQAIEPSVSFSSFQYSDITPGVGWVSGPLQDFSEAKLTAAAFAALGSGPFSGTMTMVAHITDSPIFPTLDGAGGSIYLYDQIEPENIFSYAGYAKRADGGEVLFVGDLPAASNVFETDLFQAVYDRDTGTFVSVLNAVIGVDGSGNPTATSTQTYMTQALGEVILDQVLTFYSDRVEYRATCSDTLNLVSEVRNTEAYISNQFEWGPPPPLAPNYSEVVTDAAGAVLTYNTDDNVNTPTSQYVDVVIRDWFQIGSVVDGTNTFGYNCPYPTPIPPGLIVDIFPDLLVLETPGGSGADVFTTPSGVVEGVPFELNFEYDTGVISANINGLTPISTPIITGPPNIIAFAPYELGVIPGTAPGSSTMTIQRIEITAAGISLLGDE